MQEFKELLEIAETLNSPGGCPWDQKQTFESLRAYILEEAHEVLEAVDAKDEAGMIEELGDLFYTIVFYAKIAERENRFSMKHIISELKAKLIRRHPHVFGEEKVDTVDEVLRTWDRVKKEEKKGRTSVLDGIPKTLPSLQRAQKILKRIQKQHYSQAEEKPQNRAEELAHQLLKLVQAANDEDIDLESTFRQALSAKENHFKAWELHATQD